ncbi:sensor histidine kinase [Ornithinimicrobium sp. W1679]|uniref:sensor histidine kinase n=1 Tax=Ornithinimicrobium sp. W1679 TaxID=3418770 RepID=UPI003CEBE19A
MWSPSASQAGLVAVAFAVATAVGRREGWPLLDVVFVGVLLSFLLLLLHVVWGSVRQARGARRREREVSAVGPDEASRRAVEEERARLSAEIDRSVRRSLIGVRELVGEAEAAEDPRPALVAMQRESRSAIGELRRQLGLIAGGPEATPAAASGGSARAGAGAVPAPMGPPLGRGDVILTAAVLGLTLVEVVVVPERPSSPLMSALMALTLLGRRVAPVPAGLACATVLLLGAVVDAHVGDGIFYPIVVGLLLWRLLEPASSGVALASAGALYLCAIGTRFAHDPSNAPINLVLLSVVSMAALVVGRTRRHRAGAEGRARAHESELARAREVAAERTRREVARELHDVVSHAVALVAVQAGAAELAWPQDPPAVRDGLRAIAETVGTALTELDSRPVDSMALGWHDVIRTVERLRAAGLPVELDLGSPAPEILMPTVHRIVQEGLTNVLKHAPAATAYVRVGSDGARTHVEVSDDGPGRSGAVGGYGLVGLEDRVRLLGGTLSVGAADEGGFAVRATLPHDAAEVRAS